MEWIKRFWNDETRRHWKSALLFALLAAPVGHYLYTSYVEGRIPQKKVALLLMFANGNPVAHATVVCNGHEVGISNAYGSIEVPRSSRTIQCFYSDEPLMIKNSSPDNYRNLLNLDLQAADEYVLILMPPKT